MEDSFIRVHRDHHDSYGAYASHSANTGSASGPTAPPPPVGAPHRSVPIAPGADIPGIRLEPADSFASGRVHTTPPVEDAASTHAPQILEDCVAEFTRRLQACMALTGDDEYFQARVMADIEALKARCRPEDAFHFELKAARVLAEFGFTAWPTTASASCAPLRQTT